MSDLYREFARKSGLDWQRHYSTFDESNGLEMFADLVVRKCIALADKESVRYSELGQESCAAAMDNYRELILKHFGVE